MEVFMGYIAPLGFNFAPHNWALCAGQLLKVSQNTALFSLLDTTYGGDGKVNFALPDLQGRTPVGQGQGPGLSPMVIGEKAGTETITLTMPNMPAHTHTAQVNMQSAHLQLQANTSAGASLTPTDGNTFLSGSPGGTNAAQIWGPNAGSAPVSVGGLSMTGNPSVTVGYTGGNLPFGNRNPYLAINFSIALYGIFPSQT